MGETSLLHIPAVTKMKSDSKDMPKQQQQQQQTAAETC